MIKILIFVRNVEHQLVYVCAICHAVANKDDIYCGTCGTHLMHNDISVSKSLSSTASQNITKNKLNHPEKI